MSDFRGKTPGLSDEQNQRFSGLGRLIGNTPMLAINFRWRGSRRTIYAKSENLNMTGSIKDRMALYILEDAYSRRAIKPGDTIVEATSGNTGISFAAIGRALGHSVRILMPDWMSRERVDIIRSLGAGIIPVTQEQGGFVGNIRIAEELGRNDSNVFLPSQFANQTNVQAHFCTTGPEIWVQMRSQGLTPAAFVAGVGTGGTVMGVGNFLRTKDPGIRVHPIEPAESPTLSTGHKIGKHRIQGISDDFIPAIVNLKVLNEVIPVSDGDGILMAQKLASQLGLAVGISSGANFIGALKAQNMLGENAAVVTVFADSNKKYLSTDLLREEPVRDWHLSPAIELLDFTTIKRVCETCCETLGPDRADTKIVSSQ